MLISNSYSLEYKYETREGLFLKLHYTVNVFKIIMLCLSVISVWYIWSLIGVGISLSLVVVLTICKQKVIFTFRYTVSDGTFLVKMIDINGNEKIKEKIVINTISNLSIVDKSNAEESYFNKKNDENDMIVKIETNEKRFFILSDKYMYSLLTCIKEKNGIFR